MSKKSNDLLKWEGSTIIMDKKGKVKGTFDNSSINPTEICNNIKELSKYYELQIKDLKEEIKELKSNKAYKDLEKQNKERDNKFWNNCLCKLTDKEAKAIKDFKDKHYKKCAEKKLDEMYKSGRFPVNGSTFDSTYIYTVEGTSLGSIIKIRCPICNCEEDITDGDKF